MSRSMLAAVAVVVLLAGCTDGDTSDSPGSPGEDGARTPGTTTPAPTAYDPPKVFTLVGTAPQARDLQRAGYTATAGMSGTTALSSNLRGLYGQSVAAPSQSWEVRSTDAPAAETVDATAPMTVQFGGKEVVAVAYYQRVKGSGTNKAKVQVAFKWVDPVDGKVLTQTEIDVTPTIGEDQATGGADAGFTSQTFDVATGQVAVGLAPFSLIGAKSGVFTVFADPTTKKTSTVPFLEPAGVSKGIVVGPKGADRTRRSLAVVDVTTGTTKTTGLTGLEGLIAAGFGQKHVYLYGQTYVKATGTEISGHYEGSIYAVDPATGAVVETKSAVKDTEYLTDYTCWGDGKSSVVCTSTERGPAEIIGLDDNTGKKTWGYPEDTGSRVVPKITAAFHGRLYAETEAGPVLLDATTGQDVPTPSAGGSSSDSAAPTDTTPGPGDPTAPAPDAKPQSPTAVSAYGAAYLKKSESSSSPTGAFLIILKAVG